MAQNIARKILIPVERYANYKWYNYPFGNAPLADTETYLAIALKAKSMQYPEIDVYENETKYAIDMNWFHLIALHTQVTIKKSDICYQHGRLLYSTLRNYLQDNKDECINIIETGTARGFSTLCMSKALSDSNIDGKIITFDVIPHDKKMFWNCIDDMDGPRTRNELLKDYNDLLDRYVIFHQGDSRVNLPKVYISRVHFAFFDGNHTYEYVLDEFNCIKEKQKKGDIIFFDDYTNNLFPGVVRAVDNICDEYNYSKRVISADKSRAYVIAVKL